MSLWKIAWRSIQQRSLSSSLTALSMGMGVALVVTVLVIYGVLDQSFRRGAQGYDLIVGGKGFPLQLVLNTVFHLQKPLPNIPYDYYKEFSEGRFSLAVKSAIPVCMGHDYKGCPAIATTPEYFNELTYMDGKHYEFSEGANYGFEDFYDAVVGWTAAKKTGLKIGDEFSPMATFGGERDDDGHGHHKFKVVGILKHSGTPNDRAIFINIEGFWRSPAHNVAPSTNEEMFAKRKDDSTDKKTEGKKNDENTDAKKEVAAEKHDEHADHDHEGEPHREISAILVCTKLGDAKDQMQRLAIGLPEIINKEPTAQAVAPARVIAELFEGILGNVQLLLLILAVSVVVVAGIGIMVSIYNSMSDRRHEIAVMRALGARKETIMTIILVESILLSLGGGAMGIVFGHGLIACLSPTIADQLNVIVSPLDFQPIELALVPGLLVLATLVGYLPATYAYKTDVAKSLTAGT